MTVATTEVPVEGAEKKSKLKLLIVAVVLLAGGGFGAMRMLAPAEAAAPEAAPVEGEIVEIGVLTTNLAGPADRLARVGFAAVLTAETTPDLVAPRFPLVKDAALRAIGEFTPDDLRTPEGGELLRQRLSDAATAIYPDGEVLRIVLTELIVQ